MFGLTIILVSEALLIVDVAARGGAIVPGDDLAPPVGALAAIARRIAEFVTPICWTGFLLATDGLLTWLNPGHGGSPARARPIRFALCYLTSIPVWLSFDWINVSFMGAWAYHGLTDNPVRRTLGYFLAFGAISPAMFLAAEAYRRLGLREVRGAALEIGPGLRALCVPLGLAGLAFAILARDPIGTLTLWLAWVLLLDPINLRFGAPSLIGDWRRGRWGRTLALMAGGLTCGFLWEFWNYWAATKWTYHLPFLGPLEDVRYFEMPLVGLLGFPPFALECWVIFQTIVLCLERLGVRRVEPLPDDSAVL